MVEPKRKKPEKKHRESEWHHASTTDFAKMQKHQRDLIDWLLQLDAEEAARLGNDDYPYVR